MANERETLNPELIAAVKSAVESTTGIEFSIFLSAYLEKNSDQPELTEDDLVNEILEAGEYQQEDESGFEDAVMIGASAMGEDLGLF
ncbi:hypothetical protein KBC79_03955 [Candidatus Woesebacteria bacterium]|nr:hypothetical protein [Candidatus Woesebacteria bacterium]